MHKKNDISQNEFESLLNWLNPDRQIAGQKYESIRNRLIKIFYAHRCSAAEELADETIDRVLKKAESLSRTYQGEPALYFYAVAKRVLLEFKRQPALEELPAIIIQKEVQDEELEAHFACLEKCLAKLTSDQQKLLISYYEGKKQAKIDGRKTLKELLGISSETLRVRVLRLKLRLQKCVLACVKENLLKRFS